MQPCHTVLRLHTPVIVALVAILVAIQEDLADLLLLVIPVNIQVVLVEAQQQEFVLLGIFVLLITSVTAFQVAEVVSLDLQV